MLTFFKPTEYLDHYLPRDRRVEPWQRPLSLLNFITDRARKVGLRLILQLVAGAFFVLACLRVTQWRFSDSTIAVNGVGDITASKYSNVLSWQKEGNLEGADLRIVVFGSQDVTGSAVQEDSDTKTWTQHLCAELKCTSLVSLVPHSNDSPSLTSNAAYSDELENLDSKKKKNDPLSGIPLADYRFVRNQYPVPRRTPDFEAQVRQFLSMPAPSKAPKQTLWVLSFGTWDIWNLAALPMERGEAIVSKLVEHIFDQVGLLYRESLKPDSMAFSDSFANMTDSEAKALTGPASLFNQEPRNLESFRLLVPHLFDITMTPGWHNRPVPPSPHSVAEQMRNAAFLTEKWNSEVTQKMYEWTELGRAKPKELQNPQKAKNSKKTTEEERLWEAEEGQRTRTSGSRKSLVAPYPLRLGHDPDPAKLLLNVMMEVDMSRSGLKDHTGRMQFEDIWTPCLGKGNTEFEELEAGSAAPAIRNDVSSQETGATTAVRRAGECEMPDDHLFYGQFTVGSRAIKEVAKWIAAEVKSKLLPP